MTRLEDCSVDRGRGQSSAEGCRKLHAEGCGISFNEVDCRWQDHKHEQRQILGLKRPYTYYIHILKSLLFRGLVLVHVDLGADRLGILRG